MSDKIFLKDITLPIVETGENETYSFVQTDSDLETEGDAADAKKVGDELTELKADFTQLDGKIDATLITNTVSGSIASFPDGADGVPVKDLTVQIEPVQDLHGQESPYPAGGGKNKWDEVWKAGTINANTGGNYDVSPTTIRSNTFCPCEGNTTYYTSFRKGSSLYVRIFWYASDYSYLDYSGMTMDNQYKAVSPENAKYFKISVIGEYGTTYMNDISIILTDTAAYSPYSNICPISGWTGANVRRTGKNLLPPKFYTGLGYNVAVGGKLVSSSLTDITDTVTREGDTFSKTGSAWNINMNMMIPLYNKYTGKKVKFSGTINYASGYRCSWYLTDENYIVKAAAVAQNSTPSWTLTIPEGCHYLFWYMNLSSGGTFILNNPQVELGDTATAYEPYQGETYEVDWTTEAGTVYGGTLDVVSGVLTVDRAGVTLDDTEEWVMYADGKFFVNNVTNNAREYSLAEQPLNITNKYLVSGNGDTQSSAITTDKRVYGQLSYNRIWVYDSDFETLESFTASLTETPLQVVYLITPQTYQLTPQEVSTLLGLNNIWADCGDTTVDYRADTKLYIEKLTAPSEDDMVANTNIPDATYFMVGNTLYLSTTTIPAGDTINPGTNCTKMDLAAALNAINS